MPILLTIEFQSALHQGSGYGIAGILDRALLRDEEKIPIIPGSAIKGKFREAAIRILNTKKAECCAVPGRETCKEAWCLVCRLFGSPMRRGAAIFSEGRPTAFDLAVLRANKDAQSWLPGGTQVRATTAIDRKSRTARPQHLFSTETLSPAIRFQSGICGNLSPEETVFLRQCARLVTFLGAAASRGLGHCRVEWSD